jgi:hypothetical protein
VEKRAALEVLDACTVKAIQHFINRSYHFLSAYRLGLTGKAAEFWAVRMMAIFRICTGNIDKNRYTTFSSNRPKFC